MKRLIFSLLLCLTPIFVHAQSNVGVGTLNPVEKLDVAGAIRIGDSSSKYAGTIRFLDGEFLGNVNGFSHGWQRLNGPWRRASGIGYYLSPTAQEQRISIGDSLFHSDSRFAVKADLVLGGGSVLGQIRLNSSSIAEGILGYQFADLNGIYGNAGVLGYAHNDQFFSPNSFGVGGVTSDQDSLNYGGYFVAQGLGGNQNIGVYGLAVNGGANWAGYLDGRTYIRDRLAIGTHNPHLESSLHVRLPLSGNFPHMRLEAVGSHEGFGLMFQDSVHEYMVGQNIGNWNDGRFSIYSGSSFNGFVMLQNGDIALTMNNFFTPFARLQIPQKGSLNDNGLQFENAALYIGVDTINGMAFDENQIETVGEDLYLNYNSGQGVRLADGGGKVSIGVDNPTAKLHVGQGQTVLFGKDTIGDGSVGSKLMWLPGKGGAFRAGRLNYDGSIGNGTEFWDPDEIGWASIAIGNNTKATGPGSAAIGIRAYAGNFGAMALGHLSRALGNSSIAAGYYVRSDAFLSAAVGSGNVGGGDNHSWVATDPIFEVGNSVDTSNRSNAFTVLKNGRVGINHRYPQSMLDIEQPNPGPGNGVLLNLGGIGHWETMVDNASDYNFFWNNNLKAYIQDTDGSYIMTSDRRLKNTIENFEPILSKLTKLRPSSYRYNDTQSDHRSYGFIAQEVQPLFPELVTEKNGFLGLNYSGFSVIAIKGIQELADENESLRNEIEELRSLLNQISDEVSQLRERE